MAKLSAKGGVIATWTSSHTVASGTVIHERWALRADGTILRRYTGDLASSYSVYSARVKAGVANPIAAVERRLTSLGLDFARVA